MLLSLLRRFLYKQKYPNGAPGPLPDKPPGSVQFKETGKRLGGAFLDYWKSHGGAGKTGPLVTCRGQGRVKKSGLSQENTSEISTYAPVWGAWIILLSPM